MSDFLTRLAERAMGIAPAVQPKLPRRFAQLPAVVDADLDWWREAVRLRAVAPPSAADRGDGESAAAAPAAPEPAGDAP